MADDTIGDDEKMTYNDFISDLTDDSDEGNKTIPTNPENAPEAKSEPLTAGSASGQHAKRRHGSNGEWLGSRPDLADSPGVLLHDDGIVGYLTATLRCGVWCVRKILNDPEYRGIHGMGEIPVDMEAPQEDQRYPYVHVMYRNRSFQPASLEESRDEVVSGEHGDVMQYRFEGSYLLNVYATTILERETISDCLIAAVGVDRRFRDLMRSNPYINIAPNMHTLATPTANESWGTPWDKDTMTAFRQFSFDVVGEFYMRETTPAEFVESGRLDLDLEPEPDHDGPRWL